MVVFLALSVCTAAIYHLAVSLSANSVMGMTQAEILEKLQELEKEQNGTDNTVDDTAEEETEDIREDEETEEYEEEEEENDVDEDSADENEDEESFTPSYSEYSGSDDKLIRVALMYGTNVTVGFETVADYGFSINLVNRLGDLTHEFLWELPETKVSCVVDANLSKSAMTYSKTSDPAAAVIGGWHAEIGQDLTYEEAVELTEELEEILSELDIYAIPSYIDGGYRIRAGHFSSAADAEDIVLELCDYLPDYEITVAAPTNTAVSVVDPLTDRILFEYDDGDRTALGLAPLDTPEGERAYLMTPAKKLYDGVFMFRRYISGSIDGVSLTDIIPLGEYIKGVLPYEISSSWPLEAQKAFAICVRSFTLASVRHESAYQADLCNTTHCQVYNGRTRITDVVEQAVDETEGLVMTYGNRIVTAYYSAATGGVTVGVDDAWGGAPQPYLVAVETPWEIFTNHSHGAWQVEVSPAELCTYLRTTKGYTSLKGEIVDISIDKLAKNSTYVYQITFTDSYGTKVTVKTTDGVRTALSKYVNSSNFVVGKGSVEAEITEFVTVSAKNATVSTEGGNLSLTDSEKLRVLTADGYYDTSLDNKTVISANGKVKLDETSSVTKTQTVYASNKNNFIFVGKGWGHGVGLSQIGVRDLAKLGYEATTILEKYFTDIDIRDWHEVLD